MSGLLSAATAVQWYIQQSTAMPFWSENGQLHLLRVVRTPVSYIDVQAGMVKAHGS